MTDLPACTYEQVYQCDGPGSYIIYQRSKLTKEQNDELDRRIAIWNYNYRFYSPELRDMYIKRHVCFQFQRFSIQNKGLENGSLHTCR